MRNKIITLTFALFIIGFSAICQNKVGPLNNTFIKTTVDNASFVFSNEAMYWDEEQWIGKTVCVTGGFTNARKAILHTERGYEEFSGRNSSRRPVNLIVFFDTLAASNDQYQDTTRSAITNLAEVWVFGTIQECVQVISPMGIMKLVPVMELQLVFRRDDYNYRNPIYVSREFRY